MKWFWWLATKALVRGQSDYEKSGRLNRLLPRDRSAVSQAVWAQAQDKLEAVAKLSVGASVPAVATLFGLAEVLDKADRPALQVAAYYFVAMGLAGIAAWLLSIAEPLLRARVWGRLHYPDDPDAEDDWLYHGQVTERIEDAARGVRSALIWQAARWFKVIALAVCVLGFCGGLLIAVGSLN